MGLTSLKPKTQAPSKDHYESAGVSAERAHDGLSRLTSHILETWQRPSGTGRVLLPLGHFANVIEIAGQGIAISTDGVGSKTIIAQLLGKYDTIGIDCVAMNVNDLVCIGATPISMVDYIAIEYLDPSVLEQIAIGLAAGAKKAGISISGGEISQLPGIIRGVEPGLGFDLVGAAIGHVLPSRILTGERVAAGDVIIGVRSNGIHSNGLTLARRVLLEEAKLGVDHRFDDLDVTLGEELLKPTHIYVREALEVMRAVPEVKALVHVTSEGLMNLMRMSSTVCYVIDALPPVPPIFDIIQKTGRVDDDEMFHIYNMGIGFCFIVEPAKADDVIAIVTSHGKHASRIGYVEVSPEKAVAIPERRLDVRKPIRKIPNQRP
jgi:phosphoribosylformylglycinamidine cyclo-ligase